MVSFFCRDCPRFWFECLCNRYQSACLTTWCFAQPWLRFGTVLSGFDLCPDEDVFEAFWSSECYHWFLRENTVKFCVCFNDLPVLVNVLYFGEIRVIRYCKRYYGLCLICIFRSSCFCSHSDRDEKTTRVCVFYSQPLEKISFLFPEQDCMGCSCNCGVGGNLFGADTGDSLFCLNTDPLPTGSPQCETKDPRIHYYRLRFRLWIKWSCAMRTPCQRINVDLCDHGAIVCQCRQ